MTDAAIERGLSSAEAAKRLRKLGAPSETSSRSVSSIVAGNVFTLFNAVIAAFFVLDLGLGLYADSIFGLIAEEIVPGDVVKVEPGDQLVADGEVIRTRGMTLDESMLTGEADGVRKGLGERVLSGSFCISGSGYYAVD